MENIEAIRRAIYDGLMAEYEGREWNQAVPAEVIVELILNGLNLPQIETVKFFLHPQRNIYPPQTAYYP